jgi:hypothetical protein
MASSNISHAFTLIYEHRQTMKYGKKTLLKYTLHGTDRCTAQGPKGYTRGSTDPIGGQFRVPRAGMTRSGWTNKDKAVRGFRHPSPFQCGTCAPLGLYAVWNGNSVPTFRDNLSVPSSRVRQYKKAAMSRADLIQRSHFNLLAPEFGI